MLRTTSEEFKSYCKQQMESVQVAIDRKANGSHVEDSYFSEHWHKLWDFWHNHYVEDD